MAEIKLIRNTEVQKVFDSYPCDVREKLLYLRSLIIQTANNSKIIKNLEETLKWKEPSYLTKIGSTIRLGIVKSNQNQYAIFFNCKTKLVDTFRELYSDVFTFEGNRAIIFNKDEVVPIEELKHCILLSLTYHKIKHKPVLDL